MVFLTFYFKVYVKHSNKKIDIEDMALSILGEHAPDLSVVFDVSNCKTFLKINGLTLVNVILFSRAPNNSVNRIEHIEIVSDLVSFRDIFYS